ncbi:hypothetical protein IB265_34780 [Ensifer sp. ENS10]|uniref:hypothetical protein n=1 Tax=Ensifer sp. ENS10 TaxID=2769286 RepID=UPI001780D8E7|nr:hypothetical protein [Ensifer sp. ENS10]MBD9511917.1 hypothetical protein [Ensifer sp. ENS10]
MNPFILKWVVPVLLLLTVMGGAYAKARIDAKHAAEVAQIRRDLAVAELVIASEKAAREADAVLAGAQALKMRELSAKSDAIQEYADALEDARRECLSGADSERLRDLWR